MVKSQTTTQMFRHQTTQTNVLTPSLDLKEKPIRNPSQRHLAKSASMPKLALLDILLHAQPEGPKAVEPSRRQGLRIDKFDKTRKTNQNILPHIQRDDKWDKEYGIDCLEDFGKVRIGRELDWELSVS